MANRLIAVGDIHGELDHLLEVMESVKPTDSDFIVFLGDYVDRGPKIVETLEYLMDFQKRFPSTVFLRGNHEAMLLDGWKFILDGDPRAQLWITHNGGKETVEQINATGLGFGRYVHWVYHNTEICKVVETEAKTYYFSHAGWDIYRGLKEQAEEPDETILLWSRRHLEGSAHAMKKNWIPDGIAVFGHTPMLKPFVSKWGIGLDTGAVFNSDSVGCYLTAAELPLEPGQEIVFHHSHKRQQ